MQMNAQHYPTDLGKIRGFLRFCRHHTCRTCPLFDGDRLSRLCALRWLSAAFTPIHNDPFAPVAQDDLFTIDDNQEENHVD